MLWVILIAPFVDVQGIRNLRRRRKPGAAIGQRVFIQDRCSLERLERELRVLVIPIRVC